MEDIPKISQREITPPSLYFNRRRFLRGGAVAGSVIASASLYRWFNPARVIDVGAAAPVEVEAAHETEDELLARGWRVKEEMTAERSILGYNNFYEFTTEKEAVAAAAADFKTDGWDGA